MHETKVCNALFEAFVFRYGVLVRFEMVSTCDIVACVCLIAVLICQTVVLSCYRVVEVDEWLQCIVEWFGFTIFMVWLRRSFINCCGHGGCEWS